MRTAKKKVSMARVLIQYDVRGENCVLLWYQRAFCPVCKPKPRNLTEWFPCLFNKVLGKNVDISYLKKIGTVLKNSSMIKIYFCNMTHNFLRNNYVSFVTLV